MSVFVELNRNQYPDNAVNGFAPISEFSLDNARAMMWLSQIAYETAHQAKVQDVLRAWQLTMPVFKTNDPGTGLPPHSACVVGAAGRGATFFTFAGSDPLKVEDWVTDFNAMPSATDLHTGFQKAVETVWPAIQAAIAERPAPAEPLFFTGHSLGGALAILSAARAVLEPKVQKVVVYTFGSPRTGGKTFFDNYPLGDSTFRLVDGTDIVPTVPPQLLGDYHHVGKAIQCKTDGRFDDPDTKNIAAAENKPDFVESALQSGRADFGALAALQSFQGIGPGLLNQLARFLPRMVRDHIPAKYFRALSITV
jgi:triacylglycerol lipase